MKLKFNQNGTWPLDVEGSVKSVYDTRPDSENVFLSLPNPKILSEKGRRILGLDQREGYNNVLSLDEKNGILYVEGAFSHKSNTFLPDMERKIPGIVEDVVEIASCGDYVICRCSDNKLFFLRWNKDISFYENMGKMPDISTFTLHVEKQGTSTFAIPSVEFTKPIEDIRGGIPESAEKQISKAVEQTWEKAVETCHRSGYFIQPVRVRIGIETSTGSMFYISDPVKAETDWQGMDRYLLTPVTDSSNRVTGTASALLSVTPYQLRLELKSPSDSVWKDFFHQLHIYTELDHDIKAPEGGCDMAYSAASNLIGVTLRTKPVSLLDQTENTYTLTLIPYTDKYYYETIVSNLNKQEGDPVKSFFPTYRREADTLLNYGAYMHFAEGNKLVTTTYNTPFLDESITDVGSKIRCMAAMPSGGGAYTRQYLYLFTDQGIYALTYDREGHHTNCRPISSYIVEDSSKIVATSDCVMAYTEEGCLLRLYNANPEILYQELPAFDALQWDARTNELWLLRASQTYESDTSLVIQLHESERKDIKAYYRSVAIDKIVPQSGRILYVTEGKFMQSLSKPGFFDSLKDISPAKVEICEEVVEKDCLIYMLRAQTYGPSKFSLNVKNCDSVPFNMENNFSEDLISSSVECIPFQWEHVNLPYVLSLKMKKRRESTFVTKYDGKWNVLVHQGINKYI